MPTLLDTAEFQAAKDALQKAKEAAERDRKFRLAAARKYLQMSEDELERVKKQALQLPRDSFESAKLTAGEFNEP